MGNFENKGRDVEKNVKALKRFINSLDNQDDTINFYYLDYLIDLQDQHTHLSKLKSVLD